MFGCFRRCCFRGFRGLRRIRHDRRVDHADTVGRFHIDAVVPDFIVGDGAVLRQLFRGGGGIVHQHGNVLVRDPVFKTEIGFRFFKIRMYVFQIGGSFVPEAAQRYGKDPCADERDDQRGAPEAFL